MIPSGPLGVVMFNFSDVDFTVSPGDRIAQLIIERIAVLPVEEVQVPFFILFLTSSF
jgi:dUTP pyrophosphatase